MIGAMNSMVTAQPGFTQGSALRSAMTMNKRDEERDAENDQLAGGLLIVHPQWPWPAPMPSCDHWSMEHVEQSRVRKTP